MNRGVLSVVVVLLMLLLNGCALNFGSSPPESTKPLSYPNWLKKEVSSTNPSITGGNSYELTGLNPKIAEVISRDITGLLASNIPPAKNQLVFHPPVGAVLGDRLQQQLRRAGYGLLVRPDQQALPLRYFLDVVSHNKNTASHTLRLGLRLGQWRLDRLYSLSNGQLRRMGTTTNLKIRKPVRTQYRKARVSKPAIQNQRTETNRYPMPVKNPVRPVVRIKAPKPAQAFKPPTQIDGRRYAVQVLTGAGLPTLNYNLDLLKKSGLKGRIIAQSKQGKPVLAADGTPQRALQIGWWRKDQALKVLAELQGVYQAAHIQEVMP